MIDWLPEDYNRPAAAPIQSDRHTRSAELLELVVAQFRVEMHPRYARRDVTGDGSPETFCNAFARDVMMALHAQLPWGLRANQLMQWLAGDSGREHEWNQVTEHQAQAFAAEGFPVVGCWFNRNGGPGHIAIVVPSRGEPGTWIAQAGRTNFARGQISRGFGTLPVTFFAHP